VISILNKKRGNIFISGGTGFIGTNLSIFLAKNFSNFKITIYDNFTMDYQLKKRLKKLKNYPNIKVVNGSIENQTKLNKSMKDQDVIFHLASNADISIAATNPSIDFYQGVYLTKNVLEAARINKVNEIYFTSGSGVYGENKKIKFSETKETYHPISPYGANKLASESLISAYCYMFGIKGISFRLANVVGPYQTHGVIFDFFNKMKKNNNILKVLGNGNQKKSYIYVDDVIRGIIFIIKQNKKTYDTYNVSNNDSVTVKYIAKTLVKYFYKKYKIKHKIIYEKKNRGWNGDVPIIQISNKKIKKKGWKFLYSSKKSIKKTISYFLKS